MLSVWNKTLWYTIYSGVCLLIVWLFISHPYICVIAHIIFNHPVILAFLRSLKNLRDLSRVDEDSNIIVHDAVLIGSNYRIFGGAYCFIVREQVAVQLLNASDMEAASFFETSVALTNLFDIIFQKTWIFIRSFRGAHLKTRLWRQRHSCFDHSLISVSQCLWLILKQK